MSGSKVSMNPLKRVLAAAAGGRPDLGWEQARSTIDAERHGVMSGIEAQPGRPVYGFTTLLGPLDRHSASEIGPQEVLDGHLVGSPHPVPAFWWHLIHAVKLEHLSLGGSGISPETYEKVLASFGDYRDQPLDLHASYGSGDVVPAAWWTAGVLGRAPEPPGDLIALMNGSFVSVGVSICALLRLEQVLPEAVALLVAEGRVHAALAPKEDRQLIASLEALQSTAHSSVQLPVSLRDVGSWLLPLIACVERAETAIADRLSRPSANPLFILEDGVGVPVSQSSFLSLDLRFAMDSVLSATAMTGGLLQRAVESVFGPDGVGPDVSEMRFVQPAKVVHALHLEMETLVTPYEFTGSMSGGVEDLWDGVLIRARQLEQMVTLLEKQLAVVQSAMGPAAGVGTVRGILGRRLIGVSQLPLGSAIPPLVA